MDSFAFAALCAATAAALFLLVLLPRLRRAARRRPLLVNLSTLADQPGGRRTLADLRADADLDALYCGPVENPRGVLFVARASGPTLLLHQDWKRPDPPEILDDVLARLEHEDARLLGAATAEDERGRRTLLGWVYTPSSTAPRKDPERPNTYFLPSISPFAPKDPRH
ncbi:MAG: hypothetical protein H0S85_05085 [Desulfovibrionaceae bacterium]|jgi:hypothetical protein|nr:hypothetical protein [Desulfovibrionaceae bacterium]